MLGFLGNLFLTPSYLWLLGIIPIVVLLYLLKLKRTQVIISSTLLWRRSLEDLTANAPFQKLRRNLLLLLQILILFAVIGALARPFVEAEGMQGRNLCVMIDTSASMQAVENGKTRIELAKEKALTMVDDLRGGDKMMVVSFDSGADVICELSDDRARLREAVRSVEPVDTTTRIRDALQVANSLRVTETDLGLIVLSDGRIPDLSELAIEILDMDYVLIGETSNNAGIVVFSIREPEQGDGQRQAFVLVHNEHTEELDTTLTLSFDETILSVEEVKVPAGEDGEFAFELPELGHGVLKAELDHQDALDVDNRAWLTIRPKVKIRALVVAAGNSSGAYLIKRAMLLDPRTEVSGVEPIDYAPTDEYDLVAFDGFAPEELPGGSLLFFNAVPGVGGLKVEGEVENPVIAAKESVHPLLRFLSPEPVRIRKAMKLQAPEGARVILAGRQTPLMVDISTGRQRIAVVGFDLADTNWPLHLSFPLFIQNLLSWAPTQGEEKETSLTAGKPITILPDPLVGEASVTAPDGRRVTIQTNENRPVYFGDTRKAGVYTVTRGESILKHAVNLLDREESSILPAAALRIGRAEIEADRGLVEQNREFWRHLLLLAVVILAVEWWIYSRRAWL